MIVYAAIDLRGGRVVQLVGGRPEEERIALADPVAIARQWVEHGFRALHVIDLDAALGSGDNRVAIAELLGAVEVPVQVGGGIRDEDAVDDWIAAGAARVIVGTRAVEDRLWLERIAQRHPARIVVAADVRGDFIVTRGWTEETALDAAAFLRTLDALPLAGVLVTDVSREGSMRGIDAARFRALAGATRHGLIAAGGIGAPADLHALRIAGAAGAVLGMSLYTGAVTAAAAQEAEQ